MSEVAANATKNWKGKESYWDQCRQKGHGIVTALLSLFFMVVKNIAFKSKG